MTRTEWLGRAQQILESLSDRDLEQAVDLLQRFAGHQAAGPYARATGIQIERMEGGMARLRLVVGPALHNPLRIAHGGAIFTLVDTAMAMALQTVVDADQRFSGVEAKINFLLPTKTGELICDAKVLRAGNRVAVTEAAVRQPSGDLVAVALGTNYIIRKASADG